MQMFEVQESREILACGVREYTPTSERADLVWYRSGSQRTLRSEVVSREERRTTPASEFASN